MHELEILMWWARPWQDSPVNVNFGATSDEQSMSLPRLLLLLRGDASRPGTGLQSDGWAWRCWREVMGRLEEHQHFTSSSPPPWEGMGAVELPGWEWLSHSNWLMIMQADIFITYQAEILGLQGCKHTSCTMWWTERQPDTEHRTIPRISHMVQCCPATTQGTELQLHHRRRDQGGSWHWMAAILKHLNTLYKLFIQGSVIKSTNRWLMAALIKFSWSSQTGHKAEDSRGCSSIFLLPSTPVPDIHTLPSL